METSTRASPIAKLSRYYASTHQKKYDVASTSKGEVKKPYVAEETMSVREPRKRKAEENLLIG